MSQQNQPTEGQLVAQAIDRGGSIAQTLTNASIHRLLESKLRDKVSVDSFITSAIEASNDQNLAKCSRSSLIRGMITVAEMGLLPGPTNKHVAMIPRGGSIDVQPMFRGYLYLMRKIPGVANVECQLVHENDEFDYDHNARQVTHHAYADPFDREFGAVRSDDSLEGTGLRGGYTRFFFEDGSIRDYLVTGKTILRARKAAKTKNIWTSFPERMFMKTIANATAAQLATWLDVDFGVDSATLAHIERTRDIDNSYSDPEQSEPAKLQHENGQDRLADTLRRKKEQPVAVEPEFEDDPYAAVLDAADEDDDLPDFHDQPEG